MLCLNIDTTMAMTEEHRRVLNKCRVELLKDLNPEDVVDYLIAAEVLKPDDLENLSAKGPRKEKVRFLLDLLPMRGEVAYKTLLEALGDVDSGHHHLYELIKGVAQNIDKDLKYSQEATGIHTAVCYACWPCDGKVDQQSKPQPGPCGIDVAECIRNKPKSPQKMVTEQQLGTLASNLGQEWEKLALELKMTTNDLYRFREENRYNMWAQVHAMLDKWRKKEYRNATIGTLYEACVKSDVSRIDYEFLMNV